MKSTILPILDKVIDPRSQGRCLHNLSDILFIALCTLISNGEDFEDMANFGRERETILRQYLSLPNGIPSHDTFNRVFQLIDSQFLSDCLGVHGQDLLDFVADKQICIDGKKLRGTSPTQRGNRGLYVLSAWVAENSFCIGQSKVADKSNEITAIPTLLNQLHLKDSVISIDAIGCQKEIAKTIRHKEADYLLSVKKNQKDLFEEVSNAFVHHRITSVSDTWEYEHGRYETRQAAILCAKEVLSPQLLAEWKDLTTIVQIKATRTIKDKKTEETRYYISSENQDKPLYYNLLVREHWAIENHLHWHLDVTFKEDACRARTANAPVNLSIMRKIALYLITQKLDTVSQKKKRFKASLNVEYMLSIIGF